MRCSYGASFAEPADQIWASLADIDGYLAARPGVTVARDGDAVTGSLKCTLGSAQITYRLSANVAVDDSEPHTAVIMITGREARGSGTLGASLTAVVRPDGSGSRLEVSGDIQATGRGEAADEEAWSRVLGKLLEPQPDAQAEPAAADAPSTSTSASAAPPRPALAVAPDSDDVVIAFGRGRPPPAVLVGLAVAVLLVMRRRRRRRRAEGGPDDER